MLNNTKGQRLDEAYLLAAITPLVSALRVGITVVSR